MDYYTKRMKANELIDQMLNKGSADKQIVYELSERFGFSETFFNKRVKLLKEVKSLLKGDDQSKESSITTT